MPIGRRLFGCPGLERPTSLVELIIVVYQAGTLADVIAVAKAAIPESQDAAPFFAMEIKCSFLRPSRPGCRPFLSFCIATNILLLLKGGRIALGAT